MELLLSLISGAFWFVVVIAVLVTSHELGHYFVARRFGLYILQFSVGFGPAIARWRWRETECRIACIPLGGYVRMLESSQLEGLDAEEREELKGRTYDGLDPWRRIAILLGGPFANLVLAFVAYWLVLVIGATVVVPHVGKVVPDSPAAEAGLVGGEEILAIDGREVASVTDVGLALGSRLGETGHIEIKGRSRGMERAWALPIESWHTGDDDPNPFLSLGFGLDHPTLIGEVQEGSPAEAAGLESGDRITYINGAPASLWVDFREAVQRSPERALAITVERDGRALPLQLTPERTADGTGRVGVLARVPTRLVRQTPWAAVPDALADTWNNTAMTVDIVRKMLTLAVSHRNISGPITIADVAGDFARAGWEHYLGLLALLSISLGIINLLPIPVLDGGQIVFCAAEIVRRRPVSARVQALGNQVGIGLVVCLMLLAFYNDITRYITG